ncbi:MAG: NUDIX hydrolase [Verrucomicrobia bacterium]|nr:NUDIX hydrolase [Verrucomicrobiota bacterium]
MRKHDFIRDGDGWQTLGEEIHYENPHVTLATHTLLTPTRQDPRQPAKWVVAHRKAAVVVAPQTAEGDFLLVRQERIPVRASLWEFPAGQIDEDKVGLENTAVIEETVRRELREETGYELPDDARGELVALGMFFTSQGFTDEHNYLYLARGVVRSARGSEHGEHEAITDCRAFSLQELRQMIAAGELRDANTLSLYARLVARGLVEP